MKWIYLKFPVMLAIALSSSQLVACRPSSQTEQPPSPAAESTSTPEPEPDKATLSEQPVPTLPTTPIETPPDTTTANNPVAPIAKTADDRPLALGTFASGEHPTTGNISILDDKGTPIIQFGDDFQTDNGPDLFVVLHTAEDVIGTTTPPAYGLKEGDYVAIAPLKSPQGSQYYSIPAAVILDNYNSVAVWCRQFNATFGAASLERSIDTSEN